MYRMKPTNRCAACGSFVQEHVRESFGIHLRSLAGETVLCLQHGAERTGMEESQLRLVTVGYADHPELWSMSSRTF